MPLTPEQKERRQRFERLIGRAAPFLDAILRVGERISRRAEPEDHEYYPVRSEESSSEEGRPADSGRDGAPPSA